MRQIFVAWIPGRRRLATADEAIGRINDAKVWHAVNEKARGEIAPTFLIIALTPVPVHPWSKA